MRNKVGGRRKSKFKGSRRKDVSAQQFLLQAIIKHFGGATKIGKLAEEALPNIRVTRQLFISWRGLGKVPIKHVFKLARILKVPEYALNYNGMTDFYLKHIPWDEVVKGVKFLTPEQRQEILKAKIK